MIPAYDVAGSPDGANVVLIHGFASNRAVNWKSTGWLDVLARAGFRIIAMDVRGHGESQKFYRPKDYDEGALAHDVIDLMDHLGIGRASLIGYSMGSFIAIRTMMDFPARVTRAVLGGVGENYFAPVTVDVERVAAALEAPEGAAADDPVARDFRRFAEKTGGDLRALAACFRRPRKAFQAADLAAVTAPVLVVCGDKDTITGDAVPLASAFPQGRLVRVPGRDHMLTVGDKRFKEAATAFLRET